MLNFDLSEFDLLQFDFSHAIKLEILLLNAHLLQFDFCPATNNAQL
jgi:hypothetical protein